MKVLVVSGIWPPEVGGPASHAPEVAEFLLERGHAPHVLVSAEHEPAREAYPVDWIPRSATLRHLAAVRRIARLARRADVVYSTGMVGRVGTASLLARRPFVLKIAGDPAFERALRLGLTSGTLESFQAERSPATLPLRIVRNAIVRRAAHVITPSEFLRELALGWGARQVTVLENPAPQIPTEPSREELRARFGMTGPTLVFAGRLVPVKSLDVGIAAARGAGIPLLIAGDGPERARLEALGHARFLGALPRPEVLELFRAGDASLLSSTWENFPHGIVESLAAGTPVVATKVGGVTEVVADGENGVLVEPNNADALAAAIRRMFSEPGLLAALRAGSVPSIARFGRDRIYGQLLEILEDASRVAP